MTAHPVQPDSHAGRPSLPDGGIQRKLIRSHLALGLLGLSVLSVALVGIMQLATATQQLASVDGPPARNSALALVGIERSTAALRGWVVLGDERFRSQRRDAWEATIVPAVAQLDRYSAQWNDAHRERFADVKRQLDDLRDWQWWVEDVAQTPGNFPTRNRYQRDVAPVAQRLQTAISRLMDQQRSQAPSPASVAILGHMADFRFRLTKCNTALVEFTSSGGTAAHDEFMASLQATQQALRQLRDTSPLSVPSDALASLERLLNAFEMLSLGIIRQRNRPDWDRAAYLLAQRVVPLSESLSASLSELSMVHSNRMDEHARQAVNLTWTVITVLLLLMAIMAAAVYFLSLRNARTLTVPIQALVAATQDLAAGRSTQDIPLHSRDEIGQLTQSFNRMRASLDDATKRLNFAYHRLTSLVESAVDAIITIDERGIIESVNEAAVSMFGYQCEEMIGQNVTMIMPSPDRESHDAYLEKYIRTGEANIIGRGRDVIAVREDGSLFPVHLSISESRAEGQRFFTGILYDLTEQKRMEKALEQSRQELEERAAELQRSNSDLQQFAYVASHDLQEPLRAVAGFTHLLQQDYAGQLDQRADEYIRHAVEGATRMQTLIHNLLEYSRVQTSGQPFEMVDCGKLVAHAQQALSVAIEEAQATVEVGELPSLVADGTQIQQLFQNLIGNAIKFRDDHPPHVRVDAKELDNGWEFSVADNGIGIEDGHLDRIFVIFQRLHSRSKYAGTGIGLAICQRIVQRHGGSIRAESIPGKGSTFRFTISKHLTERMGDE